MIEYAEQEYSLDELTDPGYYLFTGHDYGEDETGFTDEESLEDIKEIFLTLKDDDYITPEDFEDILNQWYVPDKYQKYLAEFVTGLNKEVACNQNLKQQENEKKPEESFENIINQEIRRFHYRPGEEELNILRRREAYLKTHGKAPAPEEITDVNRFYIIIQKQFRSKTDRMETVTDDDIIYISARWSLSPVQLIKVTQLSSYANAKAKAQEEEQQLLETVKSKYTYGKTEPTEDEIRVFVAREKAAMKYLRRPSFSEVASISGKYTPDEVRRIFCMYFTKMYENGQDFLLAPYLQKLKKEEEYWSLTIDDTDKIKKNWNRILYNYIRYRQNIYTDFPDYCRDLILINETKLLTTGKMPSIAYLARSLKTSEDKVREMISALINHMSFKTLKDIQLITKRWDLTDAEKRKLEFDADVELEETIDIIKADVKMTALANAIEDLCSTEEENLSYFADKTVVIISENETQAVHIKSVAEELRAVATFGGENIYFSWGADNNEDYLQIKGLKEGNAVITIENNVNNSLLHIYVIVL